MARSKPPKPFFKMKADPKAMAKAFRDEVVKKMAAVYEAAHEERKELVDDYADALVGLIKDQDPQAKPTKAVEGKTTKVTMEVDLAREFGTSESAPAPVWRSAISRMKVMFKAGVNPRRTSKE